MVSIYLICNKMKFLEPFGLMYYICEYMTEYIFFKVTNAVDRIDGHVIDSMRYMNAMPAHFQIAVEANVR